MRLATATFRLGLVLLCIGAPARAEPIDVPGWARDLEPRLESLGAIERADRTAYWASRPSVQLAVPPGDEPDITKALQGALDRMTGGGTIVVPPGRYLQSDCVWFRHARIRLVGTGVRLRAVNLDRMCLMMQADDGEIRGFELLAEPVKRALDQESARIVVRSRGNRVIGNTVTGATSAGILVEFARDFVVTDNVVTRTLSDGIHVTGSSRRGVVARNRLDLTGDDGIGIVSYRYQPQATAEVLVEDNSVSNVSAARGISVVGSSNVLVRRNSVVGTGRAAGIMVTREPSYDTYGVTNVIVRGNRVEKVAQAFSRPSNEQTGQGSIDLNSHDATDPKLQVRQVLIVDNTVVDGRFSGIRILGGVCEISLVGNRLTGTGARAIEVVQPICQPVFAVCKGNSSAAAPRGCS